MGKIIEFPNANEREWRDIEALIRENCGNILDGPGTLEECLPAIRTHWEEIFISFTIQPSSKVPGPLTEEQLSAIGAAVEAGVQLVAERLKSERLKYFMLLLVCEFKAAYFRRNGA